MATNPPKGDGRRNGAVRGRSQTYNPQNDHWVKRDTDTGRFMSPRKDILERVGYLFSIHAQLRTIFPENRLMAYGFMTVRIKDFDNLTPVDIVKKHGCQGLYLINNYLENQFNK